MLNVFTLVNGRLFQEEIESLEALADVHPVWVDLEAPTPEEKSWIAQHFGVSILSEHQEDVSRIFAKKDAERPPDIYVEGRLGVPLLRNSIAAMECETVKIYEGGDHQIFLGRVEHCEVTQLDHPLLYFRGKYQRINKI